MAFCVLVISHFKKQNSNQALSEFKVSEANLASVEHGRPVMPGDSTFICSIQIITPSNRLVNLFNLLFFNRLIDLLVNIYTSVLMISRSHVRCVQAVNLDSLFR